MKLKIENFSSNYHVRTITEQDVPAVYDLCLGNPVYYVHLKEEPSTERILQDLSALPPKKTMEDKFFVGFYMEDTLVAVMDLITEYPNPETAFIGWFIMNKDFQGKNIGTSMITEVLTYLKALGFLYVRLGCIKGNTPAKCFWTKNQFSPLGIEVEDENYTIEVLQRTL